MKFHLKISRIAKLVLPISMSIVLVFIINQVHAKSLKKGEVYSSLDGKRVVEVISKNELEIKMKGDIILANYGFKDGKVRIVYTVYGTKKVEYYEIIKEGLRDKKGNILYTKSARIKALESPIYYDKNTGLEWLAGPDKRTPWNEAKRWVESLNVDGGGWRMPTRKELKTLYKKGAGKRNMTPLLKTSGWFVWSGETKGSSSAWGCDFDGGYVGWDDRGTSNYSGRGFAVRSRRQ